jgi:hypothetical protein
MIIIVTTQLMLHVGHVNAITTAQSATHLSCHERILQRKLLEMPSNALPHLKRSRICTCQGHPQDGMSAIEPLVTCVYAADPRTLPLFALCGMWDTSLIATSHPVKFLQQRSWNVVQDLE